MNQNISIRYEDFKAHGGAATAAPERPPIDAERQGKLPGMQRNFYDVSQADFKRPHGMPASATPPGPEAPPASGAA